MARKSHHALAPADDPGAAGAHPADEAGIRAAPLAHAFGERTCRNPTWCRKIKDVTGETIGRDAISTYVNGRSFPTPKSLELICRALGVDRDELLPNAAIQAINDEHPAVELRQRRAPRQGMAAHQPPDELRDGHAIVSSSTKKTSATSRTGEPADQEEAAQRLTPVGALDRTPARCR
jgi:transcriptional regulator with XRE-family HTH domain